MNASHFRAALVTAAASVVFATAAPVSAETVSYKADLKASTQVPPNDSKATGSVDAAYDTASKKLTWTVTYSGLTGPATAAHFHGPAEAGKTAPILVPINGNLESPIKGDATLTDAQATELKDGKLYVNIHTAANRPGEIRGQVVKK